MGCDIHVYMERRQAIDHITEWRNVDHWKLNPFFGRYPGEQQYQHCAVYHTRDYRLFAALAGVRASAANTPCFAEPRGLPDDISAATEEAYLREQLDAHSCSYATLRELVEWQDVHTEIVESGLISREQDEQLSLGVLPSMWCQGSSDPSLVRRTWTRECRPLQPLIDAMMGRARIELWLSDDSPVTPEQMGQFRVVFWFDN